LDGAKLLVTAHGEPDLKFFVKLDGTEIFESHSNLKIVACIDTAVHARFEKPLFGEFGFAPERVKERLAVVTDPGEGVCKEQREPVPQSILDRVDRAVDLYPRGVPEILANPLDPVGREDAVRVRCGDDPAFGRVHAIVPGPADFFAGLDEDIVRIFPCDLAGG